MEGILNAPSNCFLRTETSVSIQDRAISYFAQAGEVSRRGTLILKASSRLYSLQLLAEKDLNIATTFYDEFERYLGLFHPGWADTGKNPPQTKG